MFNERISSEYMCSLEISVFTRNKCIHLLSFIDLTFIHVHRSFLCSHSLILFSFMFTDLVFVHGSHSRSRSRLPILFTFTDLTLVYRSHSSFTFTNLIYLHWSHVHSDVSIFIHVYFCTVISLTFIVFIH